MFTPKQREHAATLQSDWCIIVRFYQLYRLSERESTLTFFVRQNSHATVVRGERDDPRGSMSIITRSAFVSYEIYQVEMPLQNHWSISLHAQSSAEFLFQSTEMMVWNLGHDMARIKS
jgi:hypothetical protein